MIRCCPAWQRPAEGADDTRGHGTGEAERVADRHHQLADASRSASPRTAGGGVAPVARTTARSDSGSAPTTVNGAVVPSQNAAVPPVDLHSAILQNGQLAITGAVTESNTPSLVGQPVLITGRLQDTAVQGLTVTIGGSAFSETGIIAILIGLLLPA